MQNAALEIYFCVKLIRLGSHIQFQLKQRNFDDFSVISQLSTYLFIEVS